jgi:5-aminolevulinate synthase
VVAGILASVRYLKRNPAERMHLHALTQSLKHHLTTLNIPYLPSQSHIVPVVVPGAHHCKEISQRLLQEHGIYVQPINYPTVPRGRERLRVTPTAHHTPDMIRAFAGALASLWSFSSLQEAA